MARNPYARVAPGDRVRISAAVWNRVLDLLDSGGNLGAVRADVTPPARDAAIVLVQNSSGADRAQFEVLGLGAPLITPAARLAGFKQQVTFDGAVPTTASHTGKFGVLLEPVRSGKIGRAIVAGVTQVQITGADVGYADVTNSDPAKLTANANGSARVLWAEAGTGTRWALVYVGMPAGAASVSVGFHFTQVYNASGVTATSGNAVAFPSENADTDGWHDNVTNNTRITIPNGTASYWYDAAAVVMWSASSNGTYRGMTINVNSGVGPVFQYTPRGSYTGGIIQSCAGKIQLAANDYIEMYLWHDGATETTQATSGGYGLHLSLYRLPGQ